MAENSYKIAKTIRIYLKLIEITENPYQLLTTRNRRAKNTSPGFNRFLMVLMNFLVFR
jgi:hypothetical protein